MYVKKLVEVYCEIEEKLKNVPYYISGTAETLETFVNEMGEMSLGLEPIVDENFSVNKIALMNHKLHTLMVIDMTSGTAKEFKVQSVDEGYFDSEMFPTFPCDQNKVQ